MDSKEQLKILTRGVIELISEQELATKLAANRPLRVKLGIDPTSPDVHLGFTVVMRKLRQFQDLGHTVILIIGDYTATVGDPSGKNKARPILTHEEVLQNAATYQEQFFKVVDPERTEVVRNGDWFSALSFQEVTRLMSQITVAQMLEREDFQNRYRNGQPISLHEFLYPMMQAHDSVQIRADVEIGGMDQKFNVLRGREAQKHAGQEAQVGLFLPILIGTDGKEKMSKSMGNVIGVNESSQSMYHKLFNLPDTLVENYLQLLTDIPLAEIATKLEKMHQGTLNPMEIKDELAQNIVGQYHGDEAAKEAAFNEKKIHAGESLPEDLPIVSVPEGEYWVPKLMVEAKMVASNGEGRRLIQNGGVQFDGDKITDPKANVQIVGSHLLRVGKRKWVKLEKAAN